MSAPASRKSPDQLKAMFEKAMDLLKDNARAAAAKIFAEILTHAPGHVPTMQKLAKLYETSGKLEKAEALHRRAAGLKPPQIEALIGAGIFLHRIAKRAEGEAFLRRAVALDPGSFYAQSTLGTMLRKNRKLDEAQAVFTRLLETAPAQTETHLHLAQLYEAMGRPADAFAEYEKWRPTESDGFMRRLNAADLLFRLGFLDAAWREYGHRHKRLNAGRGRPFAAPPWQGDSLAGKKILLSHEQGLGEQIMFGSMLPEITAQARAVVLEVEPRLMTLFARSFPGLSLAPYGNPPHPATQAEDIDVSCALGDAGQYLRPSFAAFPRHDGYLKPDAAQVAEIRGRYAAMARGRKVVGIAWYSRNFYSGPNKSLPLTDWGPILQNPGALYISLQYGAAAADAAQGAARLGVEIVRDPAVDQGGDLDAFAAQVAALDHVISVSNTTVHMAGALNVPTWVLLPPSEAQFWHWFNARQPCPWYPSLRFYVQETLGDWAPVIARAGADFKALLG